MKEKETRFIYALTCVGIVAFIFLASSVSYFPTFGLFNSIISGIGLFLIWCFSPRHRIIDGFKQIPIIYWLGSVWIPLLLLIFYRASIPFVAYFLFILSAFIFDIGVSMLASKIFNNLN